MPYEFNPSLGTLFELLLACVLLFVAHRHQQFGRHVLVRAIKTADWLARRPALLVLLAGLAPVALRIILLTVNPVPEAYVMEEHNHLFLADTYALGRITNPVHPLAVLIQTYQQVDWPHHISARPPLPPIFLYLGTILVGSPFAGNLLALGLTSAALCWCLLGWVAGRWAALGSFLAIVTFCLFGYWVNSYWAPTTIVLGGALLLGAVPRIQREPKLCWAAVCVVAIVLLAGTRPYENGVYAAVIFGWLAVHFLRREHRPRLVKVLVTVALPVLLATIAIVAAQAWYNDATTGHYALMPYQIWRASQDMTPMFLWQPIAPMREFYHDGAARFALWNVKVVESITEGGLPGFVQLLSRHSVTFRDLLGPFLFLPLLCWSPRWLREPSNREDTRRTFILLCFPLCLLALSGPGIGLIVNAIVIAVLLRRWRNGSERLPVLILLTGMFATLLPTFYMNIYFAAYTAPLLMLVATGLQNLTRWSPPAGRSLAGFLLLGAALMPVGQTIVSTVRTLGLDIPQFGPSLSHFDHIYPNPRDDVQAILKDKPGHHVVFVTALKKVSAPIDPVWNAPAVDDQKIVWLRDLRPEWTGAAKQYYPSRQYWRMRVADDGAFTLAPYPALEGVEPARLRDLPVPDRAAAIRLGARQERTADRQP